jgi:hypothetical protein
VAPHCCRARLAVQLDVRSLQAPRLRLMLRRRGAQLAILACARLRLAPRPLALLAHGLQNRLLLRRGVALAAGRMAR